jgi:hypothetical protein
MAWRLCKAAVQLKKEIDADPRFVNRDHTSDGSIGDASHASRMSDHNPWIIVDGIGVVRALDIDEDLDGNTANGVGDAKVLFDYLLKLARLGDIRINGGGYLIYEGYIYSERDNWAPRVYTGVNAHEHHVHISFSRNQAGFDSTAPWGITALPTTKGPFMALTDAEQKKLLDDTAANKLMLQQIQSILLGDDPDGKGDTQTRQLASLKRIELELNDNDNSE